MQTADEYAVKAVEESFESADSHGKLYNFLLPILLLVAFTLYFDIDVYKGLLATFAVTIPIVMPLAVAVDANIPLVIGALLSVSSFGSQACFYSDSTVLAAQGSGCNLMSHAITQLPYTLTAATCAFVGFLVIA